MVAAGFFFLRPGYIVPDALATWSWIRSLVFDGDLLFFNEWASRGLIRDGYPLFKEVSPTGALANHWWIGSAWLGLVPYGLAHLLSLLSGGSLGEGGLGGIYAWTVAWLSVAMLWFVWWSADRIAGRSRCIAALVCLVAGSPLFWYAFRFPTMSHLPAAGVIAALVWMIWRAEREPAAWLDWGIGLSLGLAAAIRLQHALLLPAVIVGLMILKRPVRAWIRVAAGVAPFAILQAVAWYAVYGTPFGPLVSGVDPAGGTWAPFRNPAFLEVLFSSWNGLFVWAPVTLLAVAGWIIRLRDRDARSIALPAMFITMFAMQWLANGAFDRWWWGGMSFGPRRWIDLALPFLLGLIWCMRRWRPAGVLSIAAAAWGVLLMAAGIAGGLDLHGPASVSDLFAAIASIEWQSFLAELVIPALPSAVAVVMCVLALVIMLAYGSIVLAIARRPRSAALVTAASALILAVWIAAAIPATRTRAPFFHGVLRLEPAAADVGALLDRRELMARELEYLNRHESDRAAGVATELAALEALIDQRLR